jgi:hypothetical protein
MPAKLADGPLGTGCRRDVDFVDHTNYLASARGRPVGGGNCWWCTGGVAFIDTDTNFVVVLPTTAHSISAATTRPVSWSEVA